jgi:zinc protease
MLNYFIIFVLVTNLKHIYMKKFYILASALLATMTLSMSCSGVVEDNYVVLASSAVQQDAEWMKVAETITQKHDADLVFYDKAPREVLAQLQKLSPRYVAIVDKPENLNKDFVIDMHHVSREVDEDIYADFMWGMITGYDAAAAMKMLDNSTEPLLIKDAVATITELKSAKWFDRYAWVDDHSRGLWGQKQS